MMYALLLHYPEVSTEDLGEEALAAGEAAFAAYGAALDAAGVMVSAQVLQPASASTRVAWREGALQVQDGPYADTKEQLGGVVVLDVPDLDAATEWAARAPSAEWGTVEVRPLAVRFLDGGWQPA